MKPISTALVGYGFSARTFHLPFIQALKEYRLTAISSRKTARVQTELSGVQVYGSAEAMIQRCEAELVVITAPNDAHFPLARQALEQGKHVILEKPFVCTTAAGEALIALAKRQDRLLSVYHNRRWDGDFMTLKRLLAGDRLGTIHRFESHFDRFRPRVRQRWREQPGAGAGIWFDLGPHLVDQALQLFGWPQALTGRCLTIRDNSEVCDYFHVQLHYPHLEVILTSSPYCAGPTLRFELQGSGGSYRKFGLDPQEDRLRTGTVPVNANWAQEHADQCGTLHTEDGCEVIATECGGYQHYYQQFAKVVREGGSPPVSAEDALAVIRIIELAEVSSRTGKTLDIGT